VQAENRFPLYDCIRKNVQFWEKVYSQYTTRQGILHDKNDLSIIYTVIDLVDWRTPGAGQINRKMIKMARLRYKAILANLAKGKKPRTAEEKRVAAMFRGKGHKAMLRARNSIRLQIGQKDRFLEGVIRSGAYLPTMKKIFRARGLPVELAYLPHVESSFNPRAHSKAGAVGIWQFTRSTGKDYMTIDNVVDERYDPYLSTHAAAKFLKENYQQLGSWPLALTAYNYGRAGMLRAVRKNGSYEKIFKSHRTRLFQFASRNFYPEFLAALRVARRLENDPSIIRDRPVATVTIRLKGYAAARDLRRFFGVSLEDFTNLNPALQKPVLDGRKYVPRGYLLRLPATSRIRAKVAAMDPGLYHASQIRDRYYTVRKGDTAASIARRYRISLRELKRANNLNRKAFIRVGQRLKIPRPARATSRYADARKSIITLTPNSKQKPNR